MKVKEKLKEFSEVVDAYLVTCLDHLCMPLGLKEAMYYSLEAGGKRLRPVLCMTCYFLASGGKPYKPMLPFAAGIELIHTYSLIHDDLPPMDNDDFRRGKPSSHKRFGEATAILAGDALLTDAFGFMVSVADTGLNAADVLRAVRCVSDAAGSQGMVGGQVLDMAYTGAQGSVTLAMLRDMQAGKTGALLKAACVSGALLAGGESRICSAFEVYGAQLGLAFQIADDILNETGDSALLGKPVGSDAAHGKSTYPALVGLEESRRLAQKATCAAQAALGGFEGEMADFLRGLAQYVIERVS